jgi:tetratricopeptide (TPR) repeat protein
MRVLTGTLALCCLILPRPALADGPAAAARDRPSAERTATIDGTRTKVLLETTGSWRYVAAQAGADAQRDDAPVPGPSPTQTQNAVAPPAGTRGGDDATAAEGSAPARPAQPPPLDRQVMLELTIAGGALVGLVVGLLVYFLWIMPAIRGRRLGAAIALIRDGGTANLGEAEELLDRAITSGMRPDDVREAYFARAYVHARLGRYDGALADLRQADRDEPSVLYVELWALVKLKKYKEGYEIYSAHRNEIVEFEHGRRLASIVCFNLGRERWKEHALDDALKYFNEVRKLGIHADKVPESVSDHQTTLGILAMYDNQFEEAAAQFEKAKARAKEERASSLPADVGLLLCRWRLSKHPQMDDDIAKVVALLPGVASGKRAAEGGDALDESELLARNVLLWHAVSLLHALHHRPERTGFPQAERANLRQRVERVLERDATMPDPKLILGLVEYFFFHESNKAAAVEMLNASNTDVPEVSLLLTREAKLKTLQQDLLKTFFSLVKDYLADREVPLRVRQTLMDSLQRHSRFRQVEGDFTIAGDEAGVAADVTLNGLQSRAVLLRKRVATILQPALSSTNREGVAGLQELMNELERGTQQIKETAAKLEEKELDLVVGTGEFLLREEDGPVPSASRPPRDLLTPSSPVERPRAAKRIELPPPAAMKGVTRGTNNPQ